VHLRHSRRALERCRVLAKPCGELRLRHVSRGEGEHGCRRADFIANEIEAVQAQEDVVTRKAVRSFPSISG
jgi:hypothetical protein